MDSKLIQFIHKLPLQALGFKNIPAIPFQITEIPNTLIKLGLRANATTQAKQGMSNPYQIDGSIANGYSYQYGRGTYINEKIDKDFQSLKKEIENSSLDTELEPSNIKDRLEQNNHLSKSGQEDPITLLSLTNPEQFTMSWTIFNSVYKNAEQFLPDMAGTMTDVIIANRMFWPTIAKHGFAYNLLILKKVNQSQSIDYKKVFASTWTTKIEEAFNQQLLYAIDLRMYANLPINTVKGSPRYTPATLTLLVQNPDKSLQPVAVAIIDAKNNKNTIYAFGTCTNGTWLYALMAAKTSITLYGIWMGHVYHWHIVPAALLMTLNNTVEKTHPLRVFMAPQSEYIIPFNDTLLLLWKQIAPPTSVSSALQFIEMMDAFAKGRTFLEDDPTTTLERNGIKKEDFSNETDWDQYPIAGQLLSLFNAVGNYVTVFVNETWQNDTAIASDKQIQAWFMASSDPKDGNVIGVPKLNTRKNLITTLQSLVFRLTAHGASRLNTTANPVLSFIPNMPPCLQKIDIPLPTAELSTQDLLTYLPKTGTIGEMMNFLFTFVFSAPYVSLLPLSGNQTALIWGDNPKESRNQALIHFRVFMEDFIKLYESPELAQPYQWPRNVET